MRNATIINENTVVTIDNSGCIGEKELDAVQVSNEITAYYSARVALLEQWCAGAHPTHIFMANFTSEEAWQDYVNGIKRTFDEIGAQLPLISGSTESNFQSLQSGISITMIGNMQFDGDVRNCHWYIIGKPLVGVEVIEQQHNVAKLKELYDLLKQGIAKKVWPVGSKGIGFELQRIFEHGKYHCSLPLNKTSGPATAVIVAIAEEKVHMFEKMITTSYENIIVD